MPLIHPRFGSFVAIGNKIGRVVGTTEKPPFGACLVCVSTGIYHQLLQLRTIDDRDGDPLPQYTPEEVSELVNIWRIPPTQFWLIERAHLRMSSDGLWREEPNPELWDAAP